MKQMDHDSFPQCSAEEHDFDGFSQLNSTFEGKCHREPPYSPAFIMVFVFVPPMEETRGISFLFASMGSVMLQ